MLGLCGSKMASRPLEGQNDSFAACFGGLEALFWCPLCNACRNSGGGSAGNFSALGCWVGLPGGGPPWMGFWGMLGICGSKMASSPLEGQNDSFAACFGGLEALFLWPRCKACRNSGWGRAGRVGASNLPSLRLGCLVRGLIGWVSGVCWGFVGQKCFRQMCGMKLLRGYPCGNATASHDPTSTTPKKNLPGKT